MSSTGLREAVTFPMEVWLAGKGPSLDTFDWSKAGDARIGINEAAFVIPRCWAACAYDYHILDRYFLELDKDILVIRLESHKNWVFPHMYLFPRARLDPFIGTAAMAWQILYHAGVKVVHMVGFDAFKGTGTGYAQSIIGIKATGVNTHGFVDVNENLRIVMRDNPMEAILE